MILAAAQPILMQWNVAKAFEDSNEEAESVFFS